MSVNGQQLPAGWIWSPLGGLGDYINGRGFKKTEWRKAGRPIIRIQDLTGSKDQPNYFDGDVDERHVVRSGDLLISWAATLGSFIWHGPEGVLNQHIFKVNTFIDKRFHHGLVQYVMDDMRARTHGSGMVHITKNEFEGTRVPVPPIPEQTRIADTLDELYSDLDAGVEALTRVREKLKLYRASVLKAAVEGALTVEWRAQHPKVEPATELLKRSLADRRRHWEEEQLRKFNEKGQDPPNSWKSKYKEPAAPDTSNLPQLPKGWLWASLDALADIAGGVTKGQKFNNSDHTRVVPYLRVANVQRGFLDLTEIKEIRALESDIEALRLLPGDILFNEGGDRDKLGRGWIWEGEIPECIHQNHVFRARLFLSDMWPKFVSWCGNSYGQRWFMKAGRQSVNLASINMTLLRTFPVPLPPASEQEAIVEVVEDQLSVVDHLQADIDAKLKNAQVLRQTILRQAFTGQLVPQDSNDEPASELLKRVAAKRDVSSNEATDVERTAKTVKPARSGGSKPGRTAGGRRKKK
jgi:type I restriction enzyme, S subunit